MLQASLAGCPEAPTKARGAAAAQPNRSRVQPARAGWQHGSGAGRPISTSSDLAIAGTTRPARLDTFPSPLGCLPTVT